MHKTEPKHGINPAHYALLAVGSWQAENFSLFSASAVRLFLPSYLAAMQPPLSHERNAHSTVFCLKPELCRQCKKGLAVVVTLLLM